LLDAAAELEGQARDDRRIGRRPMLAALALAGLRAGELCALDWADVDLAAGRLNIGAAKTDAGVRTVNLLPALLDELKIWRAAAPEDVPLSAPVFPSRAVADATRTCCSSGCSGRPCNARTRPFEARGELPLPARLTPHGLRHTFASILVALGEDPRYVMDQLGHTDPNFTLRLYTNAMSRRDDGERERLRLLVGETHVRGDAAVRLEGRLGEVSA
jgi:integrase